MISNKSVLPINFQANIAHYARPQDTLKLSCITTVIMHSQLFDLVLQ
jgi:hypothetical protein